MTDTIEIHRRYSGTASAEIMLTASGFSYVVTCGNVSVSGSLVLSEELGGSRLAIYLAARAAFGDAATYSSFIEDGCDWCPSGTAAVFSTRQEALEAWRQQECQSDYVNDGDRIYSRYDC